MSFMVLFVKDANAGVWVFFFKSFAWLFFFFFSAIVAETTQGLLLAFHLLHFCAIETGLWDNPVWKELQEVFQSRLLQGQLQAQSWNLRALFRLILETFKDKECTPPLGNLPPAWLCSPPSPVWALLMEVMVLWLCCQFPGTLCSAWCLFSTPCPGWRSLNLS